MSTAMASSVPPQPEDIEIKPKVPCHDSLFGHTHRNRSETPELRITFVNKEDSGETTEEINDQVADLTTLIHDVFAFARNSSFSLPPWVNVEIHRSLPTSGSRASFRNLRVALKYWVKKAAQDGGRQPSHHSFNISESSSITIHEIGHVIFNEALSQSIPELKRLNEEFAQSHPRVEAPKLEANLGNLRKLGLAREAAIVSEQLEDINRKLKAYNRFARIAGPYNELFADLLVVAYTGNEKNIVPPQYPGEIEEDHGLRFFSRFVAAVGWGRSDRYAVLAPTRSWIGGNLIQSSHLARTKWPPILEVVLRVSINEIIKRIQNSSEELSPQTINENFIDALESSQLVH